MIAFSAAWFKLTGDDDKKFIVELYETYGLLVIAMIRRRVYEEEAILDVAGDTWVKLMRQTKTLRELNPEKRKSYVAKVAVNASLDYIRRQNVRSSRLAYMDNEVIENMSGTQNAVDFELIRNEEISEVRAGLRNLKERDRLLLEMKYSDEGCKDEVLAEMIGVSKNSVRQYLTNAKRALEKEMEKNGYKK